MNPSGRPAKALPVSRLTSVLANETCMMLVGSKVCTQFAATFRFVMSTKLEKFWRPAEPIR